MDQAEASGKTVDDALTNALAILHATRDEVEFVVLDEGKRGGLFGRGARDAIVRAERLAAPRTGQAQAEPADTRIPRGAPRRSQGRDRGDRPQQPRRDTPGREGAPRAARGGPRPGGRAGFDAPVPKLTAEDFAQRPSAAQPERPASRPQAERPAPARPPRPERPERPRRQRDEEPVIEPDINAEEVDFAAHIVDDVLRLLDIDAELTIREPITAGDGRGAALAVIDIEGEDLGLLIGRRGDTMYSLQYVVNLALSKRYPDRGSVTVDVEHYRHRREEQVMALAQRMADRVRQTGSPITLEPMSASERRLIHLALADDPNLETNSIGEGENRKVVISSRH